MCTISDSDGTSDSQSPSVQKTEGSGTRAVDVIHPAGDSQNDEYVVIINSVSTAVDMSGYTVEDDAGYTYTFPSDFSLDAGATVRLHSGDGSQLQYRPHWDNNWTWNNSGDTTYLYDDTGNQDTKRTYSGDVDIRVGTIHEDGDGTHNDEWVEFDNHADSAPNMDDFTVEDEAGHQYSFPDGYTITANGTCRLHTGDGTDDSLDGHVYCGSGSMIWNNSGDTVYLYDESGDLHDKKSY